MSTPKSEETKPGTPAAAAPATSSSATSTSTFTWPATGKVQSEKSTEKSAEMWAQERRLRREEISSFSEAWTEYNSRTIPYQPYQAYSSHHYPQAAYGHYQYPTPLAAQAIQATLSRNTLATTPVPNTAATTAAAASVDNTDVATLNDALGSAGVDLRVRLTLSTLSLC